MLLALVPGAAAAHLVSIRFGVFYSGLLHPLTAPVHLVPWLALGLLGGFQERDALRAVLAAFPLAVFAGAVFGTLAGGGLPEQNAVSSLNLVSILVLGGLAALGARLDRPWFIGLVVVTGTSHGFANAAAGLAGMQALLYVGGVALAAYLVVTLVTAAAYAMVREAHWARIAVRALGSWIAAIGLLFGTSVLLGRGA